MRLSRNEAVRQARLYGTSTSTDFPPPDGVSGKRASNRGSAPLDSAVRDSFRHLSAVHGRVYTYNVH